MNGPILIASDGSRSAEGALRMGLALARTTQRDVEVVATIQPFPRYGIAGLEPLPDGYVLYETVQAESLKGAVEHQLRSLGEEAAHWPVTVELGSPAPTIARRARERGAGIILVGVGHHAPLDRWLGDETALKVCRMSTTPVLAVPQDAADRPTRALVAIDFSDFSLRAARALLEVLGEGAHLFLVHVMWPPLEVAPFPSLSEWRRTYQQGAEARLEEIAATLRGEVPVEVEATVAAGDPADELLGLARRLNVDVIAAGSHGYGFFGRLVMGSVSTRLLRGAGCSVLITPPEVPPREAEAPRAGQAQPSPHRTSPAAPAA